MRLAPAGHSVVGKLTTAFTANLLGDKLVEPAQPGICGAANQVLCWAEDTIELDLYAIGFINDNEPAPDLSVAQPVRR